MAALRPWFQVVTPREDLRSGRPLDASEFAVHLDKVRENAAPPDYRDPRRFFERTYLTRNLTDLAAQVVRRLAGETVETSAVFNMSTQFGGGKTHALTLLYHLARGGPAAAEWTGVPKILSRAGVDRVPLAATAVFVGTEFDTLDGRGGREGEPVRRTPWGEIAWQLGGAACYARVREHDERGIAPGGDVIRAFMPPGPAVILMDEVMNYVSRSRRTGLSAQFYSFLQNLSEEARGRAGLVLAVSIPASELEMNQEDQHDFEALKKLLDRVGKAVIMSAETESAEIIRRRLFEWEGLPREGERAAVQYADWVLEHREFFATADMETVRDRFRACYPFHPALLAVFEGKWQSLPRFQKTRGALRLLALWVSRVYAGGYKEAQRDALIGLGTAPLGDPTFRAALFEQLGNSDLEVAVTTDIAGKPDAHAVRLDREASDEIKKARLHQKVATSILFESNGGQTRAEATVPEIRWAVAEPDLNVANVEAALETLTESCYYLSADHTRYRFSLSPNLNKVLIDRRASVPPPGVAERVKGEIQAVFGAGPKVPAVERAFFPERSAQIADRPALTLVVLDTDRPHGDPRTTAFVDDLVRSHGSTGRVYKSALIFVALKSDAVLRDQARQLMACEGIVGDEGTASRLDDAQRRQLKTMTDKAGRDLKEAVWRAYQCIGLLGRDNKVEWIELTQPNSSMAPSMVELILNRLLTDDTISTGVGAHRLVKYWPPARREWSTRDVRDAFFAVPSLPRLLDASAVLKRAIASGVDQGLLAYAGKNAAGQFTPLYFKDGGLPRLNEAEVEISDDMYLLKPEDARRLIEPPRLHRIEMSRTSVQLQPGEAATFEVICYDQHGHVYECPPLSWEATGGAVDATGRYVAEAPAGRYVVTARAEGMVASTTIQIADGTPPPGPPTPPPVPAEGLEWQGTLPPQKWMNFYTKVLSRFASTPGLRLEVRFTVPPGSGITDARKEETRTALRELGLDADIQ